MGVWPDTGTSETIDPKTLFARILADAIASIPGGVSYPFTTLSKATNYTMNGATDGTIEADCTSGTILITLPPAAGGTKAIKGFPYFIKRVNGGANVVNVVGQAGATIDGAAGNQPLNAQWQGLVVMFDGTNWIVQNTVNARHAPIAGFTFVTSVPRTATFTNTSTDPDGDSMTYSWNFGDGSTSTATNPVQVYAAAGTYTVVLTTTDSTGRSATNSQSVTVSGAATVERAPFSPTLSPWNKTASALYVGGIPVVAPALNDTYIGNNRATADEGIINRAGQAPYVFWGSDTTQFTIAVYIITPAMIAAAHSAVASSGIHCESNDATTVYGAGSPTTLPFQVPAGDKPAPGTDAQFTFWDRDNLLGNGGEFWDFWQVIVDGSGNWVPDGSGRVQVTNFSHFTGEIGSDGVPATTPQVYASRGPGIPYLTGLVRLWEITAGAILHPIACAWDQPANTFTYPACKSDGSSTIAADAPEGALIMLKSSFPVQDLSNANAKVFATAMQTYGLRCADNSGTSKIYAESDVSVGLGANWGGQLPVDFLNEIPINECYVVDPNGTSTTREQDLRIDYTVGSDDPVGTLPVLIEAVTGISATPASVDGVATNGALTLNELVLVLVSLKGSNGQYVTQVTGTNGIGGTWKPIMRYMEPRTIAQNLSHECWLTRASSGTPGTVTVKAPAAATMVIQLVRLTVGTTVRKKFSNAGNGTAVLTKLRSTTTNSLVVQLVTARAATLSADAGATGVNLNTSAGAGGSIVRSSILTRLGSGDVTAQPTFGAGIEFLSTVFEVT